MWSAARRRMRGKIDLIKIPFELSCSLSSSTAERFSCRNTLQENRRWRRRWMGAIGKQRKLWWLMKILFGRSCFCFWFLLLILHEQQRQHSQQTAHGDAQNAALRTKQDKLRLSSLLSSAASKVLTKFEARLADFISSCTGVRSGALTPITSTRRSTYTADPIPRTSEIVLPRAAAAIVDMVIIMPKLCSM